MINISNNVFLKGFYPGTVLLQNQNKNVANIVPREFGTLVYSDDLYRVHKKDIQTFYTIHLIFNHRYYLDAESPIKDFDDENIKNYTFPFGTLARTMLSAVDYYNL